MGHDALIRLPALLRYELEERPRSLALPEEQIEELIDEGIIGRQRIAIENHSGYVLKQTSLETGARPLNSQSSEAAWKPGSIFKSQKTAEGNAQNGCLLETKPIDYFTKIANQVRQAELSAHGKTVVFASKLIGDYLIMLGQQTGQRSEKLNSSRQSWNQNQRRSFAPNLIRGGVISEDELNRCDANLVDRMHH